MAIASAKAEAKSIGTKILLVDSGLRPIDSIALAPIIPMAKAGPMEPMPIAKALAKVVNSMKIADCQNGLVRPTTPS